MDFALFIAREFIRRGPKVDPCVPARLKPRCPIVADSRGNPLPRAGEGMGEGAKPQGALTPALSRKQERESCAVQLAKITWMPKELGSQAAKRIDNA